MLPKINSSYRPEKNTFFFFLKTTFKTTLAQRFSDLCLWNPGGCRVPWGFPQYQLTTELLHFPLLYILEFSS